jgi:hypothetical protein
MVCLPDDIFHLVRGKQVLLFGRLRPHGIIRAAGRRNCLLGSIACRLRYRRPLVLDPDLGGSVAGFLDNRRDLGLLRGKWNGHGGVAFTKPPVCAETDGDNSGGKNERRRLAQERVMTPFLPG